MNRRVRESSLSGRIVAYHCTIGEFACFRTHPTEFSHYGGIGETVLGAAFSESKEVAATYPTRGPIGSKRRVVTVCLKIKNPARYASLGRLRRAMIDFLGGHVAAQMGKGAENATRFTEHLEARGYDGITYLEGVSRNTSMARARVWIAFQSEQIEMVSSEPVEEGPSSSSS